MPLKNLTIIAAYTLGSFEILPSHSRFGIVHSGPIYATQVTMINVGVDSTRFRVRQSSQKYISVQYKKGPVSDIKSLWVGGAWNEGSA